jgi:hypothetical protein
LDKDKTVSLAEFLVLPEMTTSREWILNYRLFHDLSIAAAARDYDLQLYFSNVDRDGFDVVIDDRDELKKVQLKTVLSGVGTVSWNIHKRLLRPRLQMIEDFGFEPSPAGEGVGGGVILMHVAPQETTVDIRYYYTDLYVLAAMRVGAISVDADSQGTAEGMWTSLMADPISGNVAIHRRLFLQARSASHLLALAGFHSLHANNWRHLTHLVARQEYGQPIPIDQLPAPLDHLKEQITQELNTLVI